MKQTIKYLAAMVLMVCAFGAFVACSDDDGTGAPEITGVRITNPAKADSLFTSSAPDSLIVIVGRNLGGAQRVYINDQQVWFNSVFNTDHSLIVKVPSEADGFVLTAFDSDLKDEIRVETNHGTATYAFKIKAPYPSIARIQAAYPRKAGDIINVYGLNLVDIEQAYITDITAAQLDSTVWKEIGGNHVAIAGMATVVKDHHLNATTNRYETTSQLSFQMPSLSFSEGTLVLECAGGTTYIPFTVVPGQPAIFGVSSDMPQVGETLVITGREFVQVESVSYGNITLTADQFTVSESEDSIYVPFQYKPLEGFAPTLTVTTPGGSATTDRFFDYSTILTTFDKDAGGNFIDAANNGWGPDASFEDSGTADGVFAHIFAESEGQQWWGTMVYFRKDWEGHSFPLSDNIPATATADEVYFAVNVFSESDYNNGQFWGYIRYMFQPIGDAENQYDNGFDWEDYDAQIGKFERTVLADVDGRAPTGRWYRHVLPLSVFGCYQGKTYAEIQATGLNQFRLQSINQSITRGRVDVKFDNARIIYIPNK